MNSDSLDHDRSKALGDPPIIEVVEPLLEAVIVVEAGLLEGGNGLDVAEDHRLSDAAILVLNEVLLDAHEVGEAENRRIIEEVPVNVLVEDLVGGFFGADDGGFEVELLGLGERRGDIVAAVEISLVGLNGGSQRLPVSFGHAHGPSRVGDVVLVEELDITGQLLLSGVDGEDVLARGVLLFIEEPLELEVGVELLALLTGVPSTGAFGVGLMARSLVTTHHHAFLGGRVLGGVGDADLVERGLYRKVLDTS